MENLKSMTIGEFAIKYPRSIEIFKEYKIDFCCGGNGWIMDVIKEGGDVSAKLLSLMEEKKSENSLLEMSKEELIDYVLEYHKKHRSDFKQAIDLAQKVERVHCDDKDCPRGLSEHLGHMISELSAHMSKEEEILFPIFINNPNFRPLMPVQVMMSEHLQHKEEIEKLEQITNYFSCPDHACGSWRALYSLCHEIVDDLKNHIHVENNLLFKKALA